jgi:predicted MPP superfamily phosphohydrolase
MATQKITISKKIKTVLLLLAICFAYSLIEPYWIEEKVNFIQDNDIPQVFSDKKIVFVADIHHGIFFSQKRIEKLVNEINAMHPDIIILGGDYIDSEVKYIEPCFQELSKLKAEIGVFGVIGNHDGRNNGYNLTLSAMEKAGIKPLENRAEWLEVGNKKIKLGGVIWTEADETDLGPNIRDTRESDFVILVSHTPDLAEKIKTKNIDLVLSGHTHGGQVTFFGLFAPYIPSHYGQKYRTGIVEAENAKVLITNGIGEALLPIRFFARPQINIIILQKADSPS